MKFSQKHLKILKGLSGGSLGLSVLLGLIAILAFNSESFYHDDKLGMEFGMELEIITQDTTVWMRVPRVLQIKTSILKVVSTDMGGEETEGGLADLFPITGPTYGAAEIQIEILAADDDQMPDLSTHNQKVKPMAYISEKSKLPWMNRMSMLFFVWAIKHWGMFKFFIILKAFALIIVGIHMRRKNQRKIEADLALEMKGMSAHRYK